MKKLLLLCISSFFICNAADNHEIMQRLEELKATNKALQAKVEKLEIILLHKCGYYGYAPDSTGFNRLVEVKTDFVPAPFLPAPNQQPTHRVPHGNLVEKQ